MQPFHACLTLHLQPLTNTCATIASEPLPYASTGGSPARGGASTAHTSTWLPSRHGAAVPFNEQTWVSQPGIYAHSQCPLRAAWHTTMSRAGSPVSGAGGR
jgi:hypothetical protein